MTMTSHDPSENTEAGRTRVCSAHGQPVNAETGLECTECGRDDVVAAARYQPRPVDEVTTQDMIATIQADANDVSTFEARHAFRARTGTDWRVYAPAEPRTFVDTDGGRIEWHSFVETGRL